MKRLLCLGLAASLAVLSFGQDFKLGTAVSDFTLSDLNGNPVQFSNLKGDVTVVMFIATQCPVSNAYNGRMSSLANEYASRGVRFIAVNSNATEPAAEVAKHAMNHGFPFKVYKDEKNAVADRFGAQVTPEAFVIDKTGIIRYHGAIDNSRNEGDVKIKALDAAISEVLSGKTVERTEMKAFGCTIKRSKKS